MREVTVRGLRCDGRHGAYPGERDVTRTFLVDVRLVLGSAARGVEPAVERAARSVETEIERVARVTVAARSRNLLERVACDVARELLRTIDSADAAWVRVTKPEPPGLDADAEAVSLTLAREQLPAPRPPSGRRGPRRARRARG